MRSNYKHLGSFIRKVDKKNKDGKISNLLGLSMNKEFRKSTSNIVGTNLTKYKIVKKWQFCCDFMSVIRVHKLPVVLKIDDDPVIISPAYTVFEIKDTQVLDPEYLMMWFRRSEFDRYADFKCDSAIRGGFNWDELCETELPVPSIEKQQEIVNEYNTVVNRMQINEQLIQKLEETAQAIYREWFLDKSEENWEWISVKDYCVEMRSGGTPSRTNIAYWNSNDLPWIKTGEIKNNIVVESEEFISYEGLKNSSAKLLPKDTVLMSMYGVNAGELGILKFEAATNQACCGMICANQYQSAFLYYHLLHNQEYIAAQATGGAQENLNKNFIENIEILKPTDEILNSNHLKPIIDKKENFTRQNQKLTELKDLILARMTRVILKIILIFKTNYYGI
jgi:type I restriction enzyme S subunit